MLALWRALPFLPNDWTPAFVPVPLRETFLRATACIVGERECAVQLARRTWRESNGDGAVGSGRKSWATGVGLAKIRTGGDTRNLEDPGAGVGEHNE